MCIFDVFVFDTDAPYYKGKQPNRIMSYHKRIKKGRYIETCFEIYQQFSLIML